MTTQTEETPCIRNTKLDTKRMGCERLDAPTMPKPMPAAARLNSKQITLISNLYLLPIPLPPRLHDFLGIYRRATLPGPLHLLAAIWTFRCLTLFLCNSFYDLDNRCLVKCAVTSDLHQVGIFNPNRRNNPSVVIIRIFGNVQFHFPSGNV